MSRRWLCCIFIFTSTVENLGARDDRRLHVYVVDRASVPPLLLHAAMGQANRLLAAAGIRSKWTLCPSSGNLAGVKPCAKAGSLSLAIRVLPSGEASVWPVSRNACGFALDGAPGEQRDLAIVDAGCVERLSHSGPGATAALLAHVLAHEIGHLLLGRGHSPSGLMSASWKVAERWLIARGQFPFSQPDTERLREAISARLLAASPTTSRRGVTR